MKTALTTLLVLLALPSIAQAADFPFTEPLPPVFTWNGFYTGTFVGYGALRGRADPTCTTAGFLSCTSLPGARRPDADGFVGGSEAGYAFELPLGLVMGVEGDYQFTRLRGFGESDGTTPLFGPGSSFPGDVHVGQSLDDLGTVRGRLGYAVDRALVYATGGLAFGELRLDVTRSDGYGALNNTASRSTLRTGTIYGGGIEYAFTDRLSGKVEAERFDLGTRSIAAPDDLGLGLTRGARVSTTGTLVRAGLNYHFGNDLPFAGVLRGLMEPEDDASVRLAAWSFESGLRYFYSTGGHAYDLYDPYDHTQKNSRLTYRDLGAHAGETFARLENNATGLFAKGFLGSGGIVSGRLNDEDYPPGAEPYSNTVSAVRGGDLAYAVVDVGYDFWRDEAVRIGAFAGYSYFADTADAYGCTQVATGIYCTPTIPGSTKGLTEDAAWNALRLGANVETRLDRFKVTADAAYLPVAALSGYDHHWLRPDINPLAQTGTGTGYQLELVLSYDVSRDLSLGLGGRYWAMDARGTTTFPGYPPSPIKTTTDRYGGFAQAAYRFE